MSDTSGLQRWLAAFRKAVVPVEGDRSLAVSNWLLVVALFSDLLTPILIWKAGLPSQVRWLSQGLLVLVIVSGLNQLGSRPTVPTALWLILGFSVTGTVVALIRGQGIAASAWGWWLMFKYPLVGVYGYLQPRWPNRLPSLLLSGAIAVLCLEVGVQILQYLGGELPGDALAGTLGENGTGRLVMLVLWVLALGLGRWVASGRPAQALVLMGLGMVSSVLGEMKLFFFGAAAMSSLALAVQAWRDRRYGPLLLGALALCAGVSLFAVAYDALVPGSEAAPLLSYLDPQVAGEYLMQVHTEHGEYNVGRNYALLYGWQRIAESPAALLWGEGLGARGESQTLGTAGVAVVSGDLGLYTGTSLIVIMGELGLLGLGTLVGFMTWVCLRLWRAAGENLESDSDLAALQYALLLYTAMWPLWLWYNDAWTMPIATLLYWTALGYALRRSNNVESLHEPGPRVLMTRPKARHLRPVSVRTVGALDDYPRRGGVQGD